MGHGIVFVGGMLVRAAFLIGLSRTRDLQFYNHFQIGWSLRSIVHWLLPFGSVSLRQNPVMAAAFFIFHVAVVITPLFLAAHNILWEEAFGWRLPMLGPHTADLLAILAVAALLVLFLRRLVKPEVRILSGFVDYLVLFLAAAPFVTGIMATHQVGPYGTIMVLHVLSSELLLILIPFTKLGHMLLFFFTRAFIGSDMGARRQEDGRLGARTW